MTIYEGISGTSWTLEKYQSADKDGDILYPLGEDAKGVIIFTNDDRTSVHIMADVNNWVVSEKQLAHYNTEAEQEMAQLGYHSYSGPFTIDEEGETLTTHVELSLISSYVGSEQTRAARIEGDTLYLSNVKHPERQLIWKRNK